MSLHCSVQRLSVPSKHQHALRLRRAISHWPCRHRWQKNAGGISGAFFDALYARGRLVTNGCRKRESLFVPCLMTSQVSSAPCICHFVHRDIRRPQPMLLDATNLDPLAIHVLVAASSRVQACSARGSAPTRGATGWAHGELSSWFARSLDKDLPTD